MNLQEFRMNTKAIVLSSYEFLKKFNTDFKFRNIFIRKYLS